MNSRVSYGVCTISTKEMAFNILGYMHTLVQDCSSFLKSSLCEQTSTAEWTVFRTLWTSWRPFVSASIKRASTAAQLPRTSADFKINNGLEAERVLQVVNVALRVDLTVLLWRKILMMIIDYIMGDASEQNVTNTMVMDLLGSSLENMFWSAGKPVRAVYFILLRDSALIW